MNTETLLEALAAAIEIEDNMAKKMLFMYSKEAIEDLKTRLLETY